MRKVLGGLGLAAMIVATGIGMVKVSAGHDGYYKELSKPKANGEVYVWVSLRVEDAVYGGNGVFQTADGNEWIYYAPEGDYEIGRSYDLVFGDNGTPDYLYDDTIEGVSEK